MGKDADCCDTCRDFGHATEVAPVIAERPLTGGTVTLVIETYGREHSIVLSKNEVTVGRGVASDVRIDDSALSRRQCILRITPTSVTVEDTRSTCGTYVDGMHSHGPTELGIGSVVQMGSTRVRVIRG